MSKNGQSSSEKVLLISPHENFAGDCATGFGYLDEANKKMKCCCALSELLSTPHINTDRWSVLSSGALSELSLLVNQPIATIKMKFPGRMQENLSYVKSPTHQALKEHSYPTPKNGPPPQGHAKKLPPMSNHQSNKL
ncbi:MAG: hypothetical protein LC664_01990 [Flavobacteriales bacterium]|nr:hypothetical protein [Flavobacteriales bacterium]